MRIEDVARELYALAPEDFTSARNARAKEAKEAGDGDLARAVQALRKPTAGAWLLDAFVRRHPDEVQQVLDLGAQLRAAQGSLGAADLRLLDQQRRQLTRAVARQVGALGVDAGRRVSAQVTTDIEETLRSAMVDEAAGAALSTGLLTDTFSSNGLEPVDLSRVVAISPPASGTKASTRAAAPAAEAQPDPDHERRVAEATQAVAEAEADLAAAGEAAEQAREAVASARRERESREAERDEARRRLRDLDKRLAKAVEREEAAETARERASRLQEATTETAERLRRQLDRLRGRR